MREATVTIDGVEIPPCEVMTLRVALIAFIEDLDEKGPDGLGADEHGRNMVISYRRNAIKTSHRLLIVPKTDLPPSSASESSPDCTHGSAPSAGAQSISPSDSAGSSS